MSAIRIRPIDPTSDTEVARVANGMRATLIEVEGEAVGTALYAMDWLRDRVRWHLDASRCSDCSVLVAEDAAGVILGHTIVRREITSGGESFGLISTTYVDPSVRRRGIGDLLLHAGERWLSNIGLRSFTTWTSSTNASLILLYEKHGFEPVETSEHEVTRTVMVRLSKALVSNHDG